ncbi:MAG: iron ABC transporter permease [Desulfosporosinus sp.]|nr:iron ABC transporter permease [Desulfosporosinus sp.]
MTRLLNKLRVPRLGALLYGLLGAGFLAVLVGYPLATLLLQTVLPHLFSVKMNLEPSLAPLTAVFADRANLLAVVNSIFLGIAGTALAMVLGTLTAFAVEGMGGYRRTVLDGLTWLVFFLPSYVIAQGWVVFMQDGGILSQFLGLPVGWLSWFFTRLGVVLVIGFSFFPYVHFSMQQGIRNINLDLVNAGRLAGASRLQVFSRIILPLLTPAWLAGGSIAFAEAFGDFGIPAAVTPLTHIPLLPYQIYVAMGQAPVDYPMAAGLSLLVIMISAAAILLQFFWMRSKEFSMVPSRQRSVSRGKPLLTVMASLVLFIALVIPLGSTLIVSLWKVWTKGISPGNWTLANYFNALARGSKVWHSLGLTLQYALIVAVLTMILGVLVAYQMSFQKSVVNSFLNIVTMSVIAVPGIVMGAAFIFAWNAVWLKPLDLVLYGTPVCLTMAYMATYVPYAIRMQMGAMGQFPPNLLKAARVQGAGNTTVLRKIVFPLVAGTAISTFFMAFTKVVFELPASSLLYPPGNPTFSVIVEHTFQNFDWSLGSAFTVLGLVVVLAMFSLGQFLINFYSRGYGRRLQNSISPELTEEPVLVGIGEVTT